LLRDLRMPDFRVHAVKVPSPGAVEAQDTLVLGKFLRDVDTLNEDQRNFRIFVPTRPSQISWEQSLNNQPSVGCPNKKE